MQMNEILPEAKVFHRGQIVCHFFLLCASRSVSLPAENLCFWQACEDVRHGESSRIIEKVEDIYK